MLLLHGALQNWYAWRGVLPGLAAAGYRAAAADLRGHGASDATPRGYDLPGLADDVDALVRSLGAERAVVVGHDLGRLGRLDAGRPPPRPPARPGRRGRAAARGPACCAAGRCAACWPPRPRAPPSTPCCTAAASAPTWTGPARPRPRAATSSTTSPRSGSRPSPTPAWSRGAGSAGRRCGRTASGGGARCGPWPAGVAVLRVDGALDDLAVGRSRAGRGDGTDGDGGTGAADATARARVVLPGVGHLLPEEAPAALLRSCWRGCLRSRARRRPEPTRSGATRGAAQPAAQARPVADGVGGGPRPPRSTGAASARVSGVARAGVVEAAGEDDADHGAVGGRAPARRCCRGARRR